MDTLSSVLALVHTEHVWSGRFEWGRHWCVTHGPHSGIHSYAVVQGECWLSVEGVEEPVFGKAGDCLLLPSGRPYRVGSDLNLPSLDILALRSGTANQGTAQNYAGNEFVGIGGQFNWDRAATDLLAGELPPVLHIHEERDKLRLCRTLEQLSEELEEQQPGGDLVLQQLSTMLLVQALRVHLASGQESSPGWLHALSDRRMRLALSAMHSNPGRRWTLELLARTAGMSRTKFAIRFKEQVGKAPLDYLTQWRMLLAVDKLKNTDDSLSEIALAVGYESQSSFSTAFRRVMKVSPRQYVQP